MAEQVIRVFISSTIEDLVKERKAVYDAVLELNPTFQQFEITLVPIDLQRGARPDPSKEDCLAEIAKSDVLVGLRGLRYGAGIAELEYDSARNLNIPILMYMKTRGFSGAEIDTDPARMEKNQRFNTKVETRHKRDEFETSDQLRAHVLRDLGRAVAERFVDRTRRVEARRSEKSAEIPAARGEPGVQGSEPDAQRELEHLLGVVSEKLGDIATLDGERRRRLYLFGASAVSSTRVS